MRKYRNKPKNGYASTKEAKRAAELKLLEKAGEIRALKQQVRYELVPAQYGERPVHYIADFQYIQVTDGLAHGMVVEDVKGLRTPLYVIKRKLMLYVHGIRIKEV